MGGACPARCESHGAFLDDAILVADYGAIYDKKSLMERARNIKESSSDPRDVHVHGDRHAAVMMYRTTTREPLAGKEITAEMRIVETYVKRDAGC